MQMMFRAALAAALAAAPAVVLATCGSEGAECCDYTGFGTGYCSGTLACWEGACMPCGKDGTPACAEAPHCQEGLIEDGDFCVPAPKEDPPPVEAAAAEPEALPCGDLKWECCDIPDNDPNAGTCKDDTRMACWEGFCKPCGTDGMPACAGDAPCTGTLIVDKNNFCTFDNSKPPAAPAQAPTPAVKAPKATPEAVSQEDVAPKPLRCGDLAWECCDIPDNDPNGGTCRDDTLMACWEGVCKRCGTDGMPACAGDKPCTGKLIVDKNNFCTFDNSKAPAPPPPTAPKPAPKADRKEDVAPKADTPKALRCGDLKWECCDIPDNDPNGGTCRDDTLMACWEGVCKRCGTDGMPACAGGKPCTGKLIVDKNNFCTFDNSKAPTPPAKTPKAAPEVAKKDDGAEKPLRCGDLKWECCDIPENDPNGGTCRDDTLMACWEGVCKRCGTDGMPICAGPKPCQKSLKVVNNFCTFDNGPAPTPKPVVPAKKAVAAPPPETKGKKSPAPRAMALRCGDLAWECCDIPDNDPNGGTCRDDTLMACWEGVCKRCGTDGMPICAGDKPCTGKLVVDKNNFCTFDNGSY